MIMLLLLGALLVGGCAQVTKTINPNILPPSKTGVPADETWLSCKVHVDAPAFRVFTEDAFIRYGQKVEPIYVPPGLETKQNYSVTIKLEQANVSDWKIEMRNFGDVVCKRL